MDLFRIHFMKKPEGYNLASNPIKTVVDLLMGVV
jgi:hypothetical protein